MKKLRMSLVLVLMTSSAQAGLVLKQVQVTSPNHVELTFDGVIPAGQVKTEFVRDIIQIGLNDAVVYPAKILTSQSGDLTKVFAYQYTPKQVRCRLSVRGDAEKYKNRVKVKVLGRKVSITLLEGKEEGDQIAVSKAHPKSNQDLLDKILQKQPEPAAAPVQQPVKAAIKEDFKPTTGQLTSGKPLPSPLKSFAWLGVILLGFFGFALLVKRFKGKGALAFKLGVSEKVIEMVANQYLGPKKSISVVRVKGRLLVLGVSEDAISLITELQSEDEIDLMLDQAEQSAKPASVRPMPPSAPVRAARSGNFRDEIRKKMEGMKSL